MNKNAAMIVSLLLTCITTGTTVPKWEPRDFAFTSDAEHGNPFTVQFRATVRAPDGRAMQTLGFYDGDRTWKVRVAPWAEGAWSLTTASDDPALAGRQVSFTCVANGNPEVHGPLRVDGDHPHWFVFADGTRRYVMGYEADWLWALDMTSPATPTLNSFLDKLKGHGFNYIVLNAYAHDTSWRKGRTSDDDYGPPPLYAWMGSNENPDHSRLNLAYWRHYDRMMTALMERGITAHLMIKVYNKSVNWPKRGSAEEDLYFKWIVARYAAFPNVVWDFSKEAFNEKDVDYKIGRLKLIRENDPYRHLITIHDDNGYDKGTWDELADFQADQSHGDDRHKKILEQRARGRWPVMNIEFGYEHGPKGPNDKTYGQVQSPEVVCRRAWELVTAGAYITYYYTYTAWDVVRPGDTPTGYGYFKILADFWDSVEYWKMSPADQVVDKGYCLADPGREYVVYQSDAQPFTLDLGEVSGTLAAEWLHPFTGQRVRGQPLAGGKHLLSPPSEFGTTAAFLHLRKQVSASRAGEISGELKTWHKVTITFDGPQTGETAEPNPFMDYRLNVTFLQGDRQFVVPGYYAGDGRAADSSATSGNKWRVHFTPDQEGTWRYKASLRTGPGVSIDLAPDAGKSAGYCDGASGTFEVGPTDKTGIDLRGKGTLRYVGKHYLQFAGNGQYYIKGGADSPENFLGYADFDGTYDVGGADSSGQKKQIVGLRFQDIAIPRGARIEQAYVQFTCDEPGKNVDPFDVAITGEASDNAGVFTTTKNDLSSRPRTSASVAWKNIPAWKVEHEAGENQRTPNLAPIIQEIVGRDGWKPGNALAVLFAGAGIRTAESFEGDPKLAPELVVVVSGTRMTRRISQKEDDMEQYVPSGVVDAGSTDIELVIEEPGEDPLWAFGLHKYQPHVADWRPGDPLWQNGKGKGIIGAINYLAEKGGNNIYFLTYNIDGGDGQDTWIWTSHDERRRIDVSKMDQWEIVFSHMDAKGIQLHVVLSEAENHGKLGPGFSDIRKLYYRELVARFAHHLAVLWNLGEENGNSNEQRKAFAAYLHALDPYDHPVTVHTYYDQASTFYNGVLGDPHFEATSIQGSGSRYNEWAVELRRRSAEAGRPWAIYGDEQGPPVARNMGNLAVLRKGALWGNLMGGGAGVEWYFGYQGDFGDCTSEDWRPAEPLWDMTGVALEFFQRHLPFWEMEPDNALTSAKDDYCLALPGRVYAIYLPAGGGTSLTLAAGTYDVRWYNPRAGGELLQGSIRQVKGLGSASIGEPPQDPTLDWVVLVKRQD